MEVVAVLGVVAACLAIAGLMRGEGFAAAAALTLAVALLWRQ